MKTIREYLLTINSIIITSRTGTFKCFAILDVGSNVELLVTLSFTVYLLFIRCDP